MGYVNDANNAVYCNNNCGPHMGNIYHTGSSKNWNNGGSYYPDIGIPASFVVEDYEVFQVIKR